MKTNLIYREKMSIKLGHPPKATNLQVSKSMRSNKATGTLPEILLRRAIRKHGLKEYRLNCKTIPGSPDISFPKKKLAIFVNGCFWHRCPYCKLNLPKSNNFFWSNKFKRNKERDWLKKKRLRSLGWKSINIWECQIKKHLDKTIQRIFTALKVKRSSH
jgi:DNA mismatch endonuclease (patch repair protein)